MYTYVDASILTGYAPQPNVYIHMTYIHVCVCDKYLKCRFQSFTAELRYNVCSMEYVPFSNDGLRIYFCHPSPEVEAYYIVCTVQTCTRMTVMELPFRDSSGSEFFNFLHVGDILISEAEWGGRHVPARSGGSVPVIECP